MNREPAVIDPTRALAAAFPYDGPHTRQRVTDAAAAAYELVRYLANATRYRGAVPSGPGLDALLSHLSAAAATLPQVLRQLDAAAVRVSRDPSLYDDQGEDAAAVATRLAIECDIANAQAEDLAATLNTAHALAARLGHRR